MHYLAHKSAPIPGSAQGLQTVSAQASFQVAHSSFICCVIPPLEPNGYSLLSFDQLLTEFFEPLDRYEAQLVIEDSWTAEVQN